VVGVAVGVAVVVGVGVGVGVGLQDVKFQMNPSQLRLWQSIDPTVLLCGGFGSGKTTGGAFKFLQLKALNPGIPSLIISQTSKSLWGTTVRRLNAVCDDYGIPKPVLVDRQYECYLDFGDGAPVYLRGAHAPASYDGLDVGILWGDEIRHWSKEAFDVAQGRRRVPCPSPQSVYTSTPSMGWMSDEFNSGKEGRPVITAPTSENLHNLSPEFIDNLKTSYSPRMQKAVLEGIFTILEGAVYEHFDPTSDDWIVDFDPASPRGRHLLDTCPVSMAIDPGFRRHSWMWLIEDKPGHWIVFDQMMPENTSVESCILACNEKDYPIDEIWFDPAASAASQIDGRTIKDALHQIRPRVRGTRILRDVGKYRSIRFGVERLRVLLGGYDGLKPRIRFARRLLKMEKGKPRGIIKDLSGYRYPDAKDGRQISDEPLKDGLTDHSCVTGDTLVCVDEKWVRIDSAHGETVKTPSGPMPFIAEMTGERKTVYRVEFDDGFVLRATGDHKLCVDVSRGSGPQSWPSVLDLQERAGRTRIVSIEEEPGEHEVWCLGVPDVGCFTLVNGLVISNCDALRYRAVGMWRSNPELRKRLGQKGFDDR